MSGQPCEHAHVIADALARHDHPGMPSVSEMSEVEQQAYLDIAVDVLRRPCTCGTDHAIPDPPPSHADPSLTTYREGS